MALKFNWPNMSNFDESLTNNSLGAAVQWSKNEFTNAFTELTNLYDRTIKEIVDEYEACKMHADLIYNDADEEITKEISDATAAIATAKKAIEGMEPHLSDANSAVETLRNHIENLEKTSPILCWKRNGLVFADSSAFSKSCNNN